MIRKKAVSLFVLLAVTLSLLACASVPSTSIPSIAVLIDDFEKQKNISKEMQVSAGDTFTVTLDSNQTTGFRWAESAKVSDQTVLRQLEHKYVPSQSNLAGVPGQEVWTFKALKAGTGTISMDYSRPWEGGEKGVWTFMLTVSVK